MLNPISRQFSAQMTHSSRCYFSQKFVFFFGAPGVGKGTYAKLLKTDLKLNHISTGDEIRKIVKGHTSSTFDPALKEEIKNLINAGKFVSDEIVINIIKEKLKEPESARGVILDGFPRTKSQLDLYDKKGLPIDLVVNLELHRSVIFEKLKGRRICHNCGTSYNVSNVQRDGYDMEAQLPKKEGVCDKCHSTEIVSRPDDTEEVIHSRLKEYEEKTLPILREFQKRGKVFSFEAKRGVKDYPHMLKEISHLLHKKH